MTPGTRSPAVSQPAKLGGRDALGTRGFRAAVFRAAPFRAAVFRAALFWAALMLPGLAPLLCPYPPFQDWPAHVGVVGNLAHLSDPAARVLTFYTFTGWFKMNMLFYLPAWGLSSVMSPVAAANLCLAIAVGSLGPAVWFLCRAVDADPRLALWSTPLALGRQVYCGFGPNAAALPLFVVSLALYLFVRRGRAGGGATAGLVAAMTALAFMHAFIFLAGAGLLLLLIVADLRLRRRAAVAGLLALVASGALFAVLFRQGLGVAGHADGDTVQALWQAILHAPRTRLATTFWAWLFASYRYQRIDDLCQIVWCVGIAGGALASWAVEGPSWWRSARAGLLLLAAVTIAMFCLLPENVGPPVNWWGARLRLPVMAALLCLPLVARSTGRQLGPFIPAVAVVSVVTVGLGLYDLRRFHFEHGAGLPDVLQAMPPGHKVQFLHYTPRSVNEYPGEPFGYFGNFYLGAKGGAVPQDFFERRELPFQRRARLPSPPWGKARAFRWSAHARGFEGFLLKTDSATGRTPFSARKELELVKAAGGWRYYRRRPSPSP